MKIAIPADSKAIDSGVCPSFGRAPYYIIYDTDLKQEETIINEAAQSQGGAGIKAAQTLCDKKVDVVLVPRCGENASEVLKAANIKIYKTTNQSIENNINAFLENQLSELTSIHPGFHNHGVK